MQQRRHVQRESFFDRESFIKNTESNLKFKFWTICHFQASHGFPQQQTQDYPGAQRTQPPYVQPTQTPPPVQSQPPGSAWGRSGGTGGGGAGSSGGAWGGRDTSGQGHPAAAQQVGEVKTSI